MNRPAIVPQSPVALNATIIARYFYDGDGNRVKGVVDGETTHYPGRHYQRVVGGGYTKYYFADGQLVSFRRSGYPRNNGLRYVFRDHLGSTSIIVNGGGAKLWEDRYKAFGDFRYTWKKTADFPVQTDYPFTGQRYEGKIGLYDYNARWGACPERSEGTPPWDASPRRIPSSPARGIPWRGTGMRMATTIRCGIAT